MTNLIFLYIYLMSGKGEDLLDFTQLAKVEKVERLRQRHQNKLIIEHLKANIIINVVFGSTPSSKNHLHLNSPK